jgi:hypothetical protein
LSCHALESGRLGHRSLSASDLDDESLKYLAHSGGMPTSNRLAASIGSTAMTRTLRPKRTTFVPYISMPNGSLNRAVSSFAAMKKTGMQILGVLPTGVLDFSF